VIQPKFVVSEKPGTDLRDAILRPLLNYNASKVGRTATGSFAIALQHPETDETIGGLWATSAYNWLFVDLLFVPDEYSGRGIGSSLIRQAEQVAITRGHAGIRLDTMSFQAPGFYEKLGYQRFGRLENYPMGYEHIYYFKVLPGHQSPPDLVRA
jgi:GNAT superfamily N-acetyltransferase